MYVMQIGRHSPESCPDFNKETKKTTLAIMQQMNTLLPKHGIKSAGMWVDHGNHTTYIILDTPSLDAYWALVMEPVMAAYLSFNSVTNSVVMGPEEAMALLQRD